MYACFIRELGSVQNDDSHHFLLGTLLSSILFAAIRDEGLSKDLQYPGTEGPSHTNPLLITPWSFFECKEAQTSYSLFVCFFWFWGQQNDDKSLI